MFRLHFRSKQLRNFRGLFQNASRTKREFEAPTVNGFLPRFQEDRNPKIKAVTYNILAQNCAFHEEIRFCPRELLEWKLRKKRLQNELENYDADLLCLQDVERSIYYQQLEPWFLENGYEGIFYCKPPEIEEGFEQGVALLYKTSVFNRVSSVCAPFKEYFEPVGYGLFYRRLRSCKDGFAMVLLSHIHSSCEVLVSGLQLHDDPYWPDARIAQIHVMCETMSTFLERQSRSQRTPIILLGDFASYWRKWTPDPTDKWVEDRFITSGFYSLLTEGILDTSHCHHPYVRNHQGNIKSSNLRSVQFNTSNLLFESAYFRAHGLEPLVTKCTPLYKNVSDYIFYTPHSIDTKETLQLPYISTNAILPQHVKILPMPNAQYPSSHFAIGATLELRGQSLLTQSNPL
eukprot:g2538.t1